MNLRKLLTEYKVEIPALQRIGDHLQDGGKPRLDTDFGHGDFHGSVLLLCFGGHKRQKPTAARSDDGPSR